MEFYHAVCGLMHIKLGVHERKMVFYTLKNNDSDFGHSLCPCEERIVLQESPCPKMKNDDDEEM